MKKLKLLVIITCLFALILSGTAPVFAAGVDELAGVIVITAVQAQQMATAK